MSSPKDLALERLIQKAIDGDIESRMRLIEHPEIRRMLSQVGNWASRKFSLEAEDVNEFLLLKLFNRIDTLKDPSQLTRWCYRLAEAHGLNHVRHSKVEATYRSLVAVTQGEFGKWRGDPLPPHHVESSSPEEELLLRERELVASEVRERLDREVARVIESVQKSIWDAWAKGKSLKEISGETNLPISTVARRLKQMQKAVLKTYLSEIETIRDRMKLSQLTIEDEKNITRSILEGLRSE